MPFPARIDARLRVCAFLISTAAGCGGELEPDPSPPPSTAPGTTNPSDAGPAVLENDPDGAPGEAGEAGPSPDAEPMKAVTACYASSSLCHDLASCCETLICTSEAVCTKAVCASSGVQCTGDGQCCSGRCASTGNDPASCE